MLSIPGHDPATPSSDEHASAASSSVEVRTSRARLVRVADDKGASTERGASTSLELPSPPSPRSKGPTIVSISVDTGTGSSRSNLMTSVESKSRSVSMINDDENLPPSKQHSHLSSRSSLGACAAPSVQDLRFGLDQRAGLKAFRLIGGFDGISIDELEESAVKVQNKNVRVPLLRNLESTFAEYDADENGLLDILEFEKMMLSSTLVQQAVYELLELAEAEERDQFMVDNTLHEKHKHFDAATVMLTILYVVVLSLQIDIEQDWKGWRFIELCFLILFSVEIGMRFHFKLQRDVRGSRLEILRRYIVHPFHLFDVLITAIGWLELVASAPSDFDRSATRAIKTLRWIRLFRFLRCIRLCRLFWYCTPLRVLLTGIYSSMKSAFWGFSLMFLIVLLWAVVVRTAATSEDYNALLEVFPTVPETMLLVFRCMALSADGSCSGRSHNSIFFLLSDEFGWVFNILWVVSEVFILIGILNAVASLFFVHADENKKIIMDKLNMASYRDDIVRLQQLDKILRTLIHPGREQSNPKDRNATEVAALIRKARPDAAAKIPNLEVQLVGFAQSIQEAKRIHESAMNTYEAKEVTECKRLRALPSAKSYMVDGKKTLLVEDIAQTNNSLLLPVAPIGAIEINARQEHDNLPVLLDDAKEVQRFMKEMVYPNSDWAGAKAAGASGNIWKASKGLCDEAIDPGIKTAERIEEKVRSKYAGRYERNRDYSRLALIYNSVRHLMEAVPRFLAFSLDSDGLEVVSLENRFAEPHVTGWRDVTLLVKVAVPISPDVDTDANHIMELQLRLRRLAEVCHEGHKFYEEIRSNVPDDLLPTILDRLVTDTTLDLGITKTEWLQCLGNKEVKNLLDALRIPRHCLKSLFDTIDIDGSGTITSSELREMLLLVKNPVHSHELTSCHLRVKELQRQLQTRFESQLVETKHFALKCMDVYLENQEFVAQEFYAKIQALMKPDFSFGSPDGPHTPKSPRPMWEGPRSPENSTNTRCVSWSDELYSKRRGHGSRKLSQVSFSSRQSLADLWHRPSFWEACDGEGQHPRPGEPNIVSPRGAMPSRIHSHFYAEPNGQPHLFAEG